MITSSYLKCIFPTCDGQRDIDATEFECPRCQGLLDVEYDWNRFQAPKSLREIESRWAKRSDPLCFSGVWRFSSLLPFAPSESVVTIGEGQTILQRADQVGRFAGMAAGSLYLQYEGMNPSGSFKDNGMSAAFTHARIVGAKSAACASTGNTSASLAMYCSATQLMRSIVFIGSGKISYGKLAQALDYGALTLQIDGDFDDAMRRVQQVSRELGIYLVNSINPFRLEGQKTIMYRVLEALDWEPPDWIVVPGGNLGNTSAFGKAFAELKRLELIKRIPKIAVINAAGASTFFDLYEKQSVRWNGGKVDKETIDKYYGEMDRKGAKADTIASAIEINRPVNLLKSLRTMETCGGAVRSVSDEEIMNAKAQIGAGGFGCEPASAASLAGLKNLRAQGIISQSDRVVCILTGHQLKDPTATVAYHGSDAKQFADVLGKRGVKTTSYANRPVSVANDLDAIVAAIKAKM